MPLSAKKEKIESKNGISKVNHTFSGGITPDEYGKLTFIGDSIIAVVC